MPLYGNVYFRVFLYQYAKSGRKVFCNGAPTRRSKFESLGQCVWRYDNFLCFPKKKQCVVIIG